MRGRAFFAAMNVNFPQARADSRRIVVGLRQQAIAREALADYRRPPAKSG